MRIRPCKGLLFCIDAALIAHLRLRKHLRFGDTLSVIDIDYMRSLSGKGCHCGIGRIDVHIGSAGGKAEA